MPNGKRPKLRALEAFEAVSRHLSISRAAEELGVTQSAISHQLKQLREEVGESLLQKSGRGIALTDMGRQLAVRIQEAFGQIDRSVADVVGTGSKRVRIAVCSSFAPGWLIGRLDSFYAANPGIDLQLQMYAKDPELTDTVGDAFVTTLPDQQLGYFALKIMDERLVAVYLASKAGQVPGLPLITTDLDPDRVGDDWKAFCKLADIAIADLRRGEWLFASHYVMALNMAQAGLGIALVPDFLTQQAIATGQLRQFSSTALPTNEDYYLCVKNSRRDEPPLRALVNWFRGQINGSASQERLKETGLASLTNTG